MDNMKRFVSFLLCFVMVLGFVPVNAFAADTANSGVVDAALFFSDLHTTADSYKENEIIEVMGGVKKSGLDFSTVTCAGDAFSSNDSVIKGRTTTAITAAIRNGLGDAEVPVNYVWSDHDRETDVENFTGLMYSGENYYIYSISMSDMSSSTRYGQPTTFTEDKLTAFTKTVEGLDHSKPLFIASHMPLHDRRDDNQWADEWYGVISAAAEKMDIVFLWGHNHTQEKTPDVDGYYVAKNGNEKMTIDGVGSIVPNFTYLNAGYLSPASTGYTYNTTRQGVVVAAAITEESIILTAYDKNGVHSGTYAMNETVARDHASSWTTLVEPTKSTVYVYEQVDTIVAGESYAIVGETSNYALNPKDITHGLEVDTSGSTMTADFEVPLWTFESATFGKIHSGDTYVSRWSSLTTGSADKSSTFTITDNGNTFSLLCGSYHGDSPSNSLYCSGSGWALQGKNGVVRLFASNGTTTVQNQDGLYGRIEGDTAYTVAAGSAFITVEQLVKAGITAYTTNDPTDPVGTAISDNDLIVTSDYTNTSGAGEYTVTISYKVVEQGESVPKKLGQVTLTAVESDPSTPSEPTVDYAEGNNYPEYPDEGAVKVNKTGTGIDFQSTGIARVEISASGVPMKRGIDIIVMLDTSSSMDRCISCGKYTGYYSDKSRACNCSTKVARVDELRDALDHLKNTLVSAPGAEDIRIAVADFNGMYTSGPYAYSDNDEIVGKDGLNASSNAKVYTGTKNLTYGAFVSPSELNANAFFPKTTNTNASAITFTGTNYDYAFDAIYQLGHAIKTQNEANGDTDRELIVLFMSDGAPNQYNFFRSQGGDGNGDESFRWNKWLQGTFASGDLTSSNLQSTTHKHYYDLTDWDGDGIINEHRMANAIKGDPNVEYKVIRKNQNLSNLNANGNDAVTALLKATNETDVYELEGLGAKMYAVGFFLKNDGPITLKSVQHVLGQIPSSPEMYITADNEGALSKAFEDIANDILYAAYNARFVDQMGKDYDLQMKPLVDLNGEYLDNESPNSRIDVIEYDIYTRADYLGGKCTEDKIGTRKGTSKTVETVTFSFKEVKENNKVVGYEVTGAYSSLIGEDTNILGSDGIIRAKNFYYNTNNKGVAIEDKDANGNYIVNIPTGVNEYNLTTGSTNVLPAESFYWGMGTIKNTELALRYYVYLTGSMEGTREAGSFPTNNYANVYYDNYLGNPAHKDTVSPVMPWKEANISYAFYLVDENGNVVVNQTTGETGSFANKVAVTNPVQHTTVKLNADGSVDIAELVAAGVLPEGYVLYAATYDENGDIVMGPVYTVSIESDGKGGWTITNPVGGNNTTYVTQHDPNNGAAYSNEATTNNGSYDYTHTVVWFAVVWSIQPLPDTVVVDYGLPVDISVLANDMFGDNGKLAGVGALNATGIDMDGHTENNALSTDPHKGTYGTATANTTTGKVRYSLETMEMNSHEQFAYSVQYTGANNAGYYYETVTVIPATTIYYEDSFVKYDSFTWDNEKNDWTERSETLWSTEGETVKNAVQSEDRPGQYALTDANNIYGYDGVNLNMSTFSLGSAHVATVDYDNYASAQFTFYGTGFDIISMTDTTTGTILVDVEKEENGTWTKVDGYAVDTYYGYTQDNCHVSYTCRPVKDAEGNVVSYQWVRTAVYHARKDCTEACKIAESLPVASADNVRNVVDIVENAWIPCATDNQIYQVPVIKMANKPYGHYRVTIKATYDEFFDHVAPSNETGSYKFYLDAIRIYDPANDGAGNKVIEDAYVADGEGWPSYIELRNGLIAAGGFNEVITSDMNVAVEGLVFIDGDASVGNAQLVDYMNYGPNNEVYIAPGQRVAFLLNTPANIANVHIGISVATAGETATYTITNIAKESSADGKVKQGDYYNPKTFTLDTTTDMYYDLSGWKGDIIVISNTGNREENKTSGVISVTNIKSTYKSNPNGSETSVVIPGQNNTAAENQNLTSIYMTADAVETVLNSLNAQQDVQTPVVPEEPEVPEITQVFAPKLFHVMLNKNEIKTGQKVLVTVTTSADVEYIMINGEKVTKFAVGETGNRTWKLNVTSERVGNMTVEVVCYNTKGIASEAVTETVKVRAKTLRGVLGDITG